MQIPLYHWASRLKCLSAYLVVWPGLREVDLPQRAGGVEGPDDPEGGAEAAGGQGTRVAVRQDLQRT